jgi:hypothetical protein
MKKVSTSTTINGIQFDIVCFNAEGRNEYKWKGQRKCFDIYISVNGNRKKFHFWDSISRFPQSANEETLLSCLECTLNDALAYDQCYNLADFCNEFGYEKHIEGLNAYNGCKRAYFFYEDCGVDIYETINILNDYAVLA